jgi:hypothetical protein
MDKILVCLFVPAVQQSFDLFVPPDLEIGKLTSVIAGGVEELCRGQYVSSHEEMLSQKDPDLLLNPFRTLASYGIKDGAELIML